MKKKIFITLIAFVLMFLSLTPSALANSDRVPEVSQQNADAKNGIYEEGGHIYYYEDGVIFKGGYKVVKINGKKYHYYFSKKNGRATTNKLAKVTINGKKYYFYFTKNGRAAVKKWCTIKGKTYYFGSNGRAYTGVHNITHFYYKFSSKGVLKRKIDKNKKMVALTYDDGPSIYTPKVLDALEKYDAVATFFVVGNRVSTYSEHVKRAYDMGCEIGNHTYEHMILTKASAAQIKSQISKTNKAVKKVTGVNPVVMRPPGGARNSTVNANVGMPMIIWSVDPTDWKTRNQKKTEDAVLGNVKDGDVVLMHDLYNSTACAAPKILSTLKARGYQFVTVSELAMLRGTKLKKGMSYSSFRK